MAYTTNKLAKLSGVSVRTLHFYDEIGLLKPAYYGENNYRYYEEQQLQILQQILFFRELGFQLSDIRRILSSSDFDMLKSLESHREVLVKTLDRTNKLINTIDKTIAHIRGNIKMKDEELYYGFDSGKQKEHEEYLINKGVLSQEFMDECNEKVKGWSDNEKNEFIHDIDRIMASLVTAIEAGLTPFDSSVQELMHQHYDWLIKSWNPTKERYLDLAELYQTLEFRVFYDKRHPKLLEFFIKAMKVYADKQLS